MKTTKSFLYLGAAIFIAQFSKAQNTTFNSMTGVPMYNTNLPAIIEWPTSNYGAGFSHKIYNDDNNGKTYLKIAARHNSTTWVDHLTITSDGYVGIGTSAPQTKLELFDASANLTLLKLRNNNWTCNQTTAIEFWNGSNKSFATSKIISKMDGCGTNGEALVFETQTAGDNFTTPKLTITNGGRVLIGTKSQTSGTHTNALLHVYGKAVATEVVVTQLNWADFVFDKNYKLMPLTELENYYTTNHHLPQVPSTKEISENGNDLGKTDALLLQKIEELTLYVVEQQKLISILQKEISNLKN